MLALRVPGWPIPAIVTAFGLDERIVWSWPRRSGAYAALLGDQ